MDDAIKKILYLFTGSERRSLAILLLVVLFTAIFETLGVASVLPLIGLVMNPNLVNENIWLHKLYILLGFNSTRNFIVFIAMLMFFIIIVGNGFSAFSTWFKLKFVWRSNHNISLRLLEKYLSQPYAYFLNKNSADMSKNILQETNQLTTGFLIPLVNFAIKLIVIILILLLLFLVNPWITLLAIGFLGGAYALIYYIIRQKLKTSGRERMAANQERFRVVNEAIGGIKDIKVMGREAHFLKRFAIYSARQAKLLAWNSVIGLVPRYALESMAFGGVILLIMVLFLSSHNAAEIIPIVGFYAFAGYRLMPALQDIFAASTQIKFNQPIVNKIFEELSDNSFAKEVVPSPDEDLEVLPFRNCLEMMNVFYAYPQSSKWVISDVSLKIARGTSTGFIGLTGAGKTTLVDIFLGLLMSNQGKLLVDGVEVTRENIAHWRKNVGYVPQSIYLSDDTVTRNIAFGLPDADIEMDKVIQAATIANIHEFIVEGLPQAYDTKVGERGIRLSGGQRQRIGIARALYSNPEILFLDEATSSLDGFTEEAFVDALTEMAAVKTLIIIAHRLNTVKNCDQIYLVDNGEIMDQGTYVELMERNELFRAMARMPVDEQL